MLGTSQAGRAVLVDTRVVVVANGLAGRDRIQRSRRGGLPSDLVATARVTGECTKGVFTDGGNAGPRGGGGGRRSHGR